jgi:hypothetical protein
MAGLVQRFDDAGLSGSSTIGSSQEQDRRLGNGVESLTLINQVAKVVVEVEIHFYMKWEVSANKAPCQMPSPDCIG